jgi:hypothetical protein
VSEAAVTLPVVIQSRIDHVVDVARAHGPERTKEEGKLQRG